MTRNRLLLLAGSVVAGASYLSSAEADPATFERTLPGDTLLYLDIDVAHALKGPDHLDIARLLRDEEVAAFLAPAE